MARKIAIHKHTKGDNVERKHGSNNRSIDYQVHTYFAYEQYFFFHVVKFNRLTINECLGMLVKSL